MPSIFLMYTIESGNNGIYIPIMYTIMPSIFLMYTIESDFQSNSYSQKEALGNLFVLDIF